MSLFEKSNPQAGDVYVRPLLTSVAYTYATKDMVGQSAAMATRNQSRVGVRLQTSYYTKYNKGDVLRAILEPRSPGTRFSKIGFDVDNSNYYNCKVYGGESEISDEVRANYTLQDSLEGSRTRLLTRAAVARREQMFADNLFATSGTWDKVVAGTAGSPTAGTSFKYWNVSGATPIADIKYGRTYVGDQTGIDPNTLILSQNVWDAITEAGDVVDRLTYANKGIVTEDLFAEMCGIKRVIVGKFRRNTANKGATNAIANVLGDKALLCYLPDSPGPEEMAAFQTFEWEGLTGAAGGMRALVVRDQLVRADQLQMEDSFDVKLTCSDLGFLFNDCTQ